MDPEDPRARRSRAAILDAAIRVITRSGISAATMDAVASEAGVARSTLYRHFDDFAELLFAALDVLAPPPAPVDGSPLARLEAATLGLGRALREGAWGRVVGSILERAERDPQVRRFHAEFTAARRRPMLLAAREAVAEGLLDPVLDADDLTTQLIAPLYYRHLVLHRPMRDDEVRDHVDRTLEPVRAGARAQHA